MMFRSFRRLLHSRPWRSCLSTHFLPPQLVAGPGAPPFGLVITDYTLHRYWVQPRVPAYFVATGAVADELAVRVPGARVHVTGIPIDAGFASAPDWRAARAALALSADSPVALVMGGGFGLGVEEAVAAALQAPVPGLQVVAVCGRNEGALRHLAGVEPDRLRVLGFRRDLPHLFAAADVIVTKPGGLTTSEALACGRPLLLTRPIPGHEEANATVLVAAGAARPCPDGRALTDALAAFFAEPETRLRMAAAARRMAAPDAARRIARSAIEYHRIRAVA
jgi:processive 1,2-diacylglycerol beta-glucosyltransferase